MKYIPLAAALMLVGAGCSLNSNTTADVSVDTATTDTAMTSNTNTSMEGNAMTMTDIESGTYAITIGEAHYIAQKEFFSKPHQEVLGTTEAVTGTIVVNNEAETVTVNATIANSFKTDSSMRDGDVEKMLAGPIEIHAENISFSDLESGNVTLRLTIAGETRDIPFTVNVVQKNESLNASGSGSFLISDFALNAPSLLNVYTVDDALEVQFAITAAMG